MRLAIFLDQIFWRDGKVLSTDESYALFFERFAESVNQIVFIGREARESGRRSFVLDYPNISLCPIPYYSNLYNLWRSNPSIYLKIRRTVLDFANDWDAILIHGPHPLGQMIARHCSALGVPVILILRQNLVKMMSTHSGAKRVLATMAASVLERDFKRLARYHSTLAVGMEMAEAYRRVSDRVYNFMPCLIDDAQFRTFAASLESVDSTRLISVGRLSAEKGHRYLLEALAILKSRGLVCHLDVVGSGPQEEELKRVVVGLGLGTQITFHGFVGYGRALFDLYHQAGAAVLPSTTEGLPQVINEYLSIGLPTIATNVGGIPAFLTNSDTALLVPPCDAPALAGAIERLVGDEELRNHLRRNGRLLMAGNTLESNRELVMKVVRDEVYARQARVPFAA